VNVPPVSGPLTPVTAPAGQAGVRRPVATQAQQPAGAVSPGGDGDGDHGIEPAGQKIDVRG
jgi:hypothetical protein